MLSESAARVTTTRVDGPDRPIRWVAVAPRAHTAEIRA
jgi:hypothetical protein